MGSRGYDDGGADLTGGDSRNIRYNHVSRDDGEISARWSVARSPLAHSGPRGGSSFTQPERFIGNARRQVPETAPHVTNVHRRTGGRGTRMRGITAAWAGWPKVSPPASP